MSTIELQAGDATLSGMRKPKKGSKPKDRHVSPRLAFHVPGEYLDALKERASLNRRTISEELRIALERYLWPDGKPEGD